MIPQNWVAATARAEVVKAAAKEKAPVLHIPSLSIMPEDPIIQPAGSMEAYNTSPYAL